MKEKMTLPLTDEEIFYWAKKVRQAYDDYNKAQYEKAKQERKDNARTHDPAQIITQSNGETIIDTFGRPDDRWLDS